MLNSLRAHLFIEKSRNLNLTKGIYKVIIRLIVKYIFIINFIRDINVNTIHYKFGQTLTS